MLVSLQICRLYYIIDDKNHDNIKTIIKKGSSPRDLGKVNQNFIKFQIPWML